MSTLKWHRMDINTNKMHYHKCKKDKIDAVNIYYGGRNPWCLTNARRAISVLQVNEMAYSEGSFNTSTTFRCTFMSRFKAQSSAKVAFSSKLAFKGQCAVFDGKKIESLILLFLQLKWVSMLSRIQMYCWNWLDEPEKTDSIDMSPDLRFSLPFFTFPFPFLVICTVIFSYDKLMSIKSFPLAPLVAFSISNSSSELGGDCSC